MSNQTITIGQLLQVPPGDRNNPAWVNADFEGVFMITKQGQTKTGQAMTNVSISDAHQPNIAIAATIFGRNCSSYHGCLCRVSGSGISRTEYNGTQQVTIGDKATINVVGRVPGQPAAEPPQQQAPVQSYSAPRQRTHNPAPAANTAVHGATVGMAINQAVGIIKDRLMDSDSASNAEYVNSPIFTRDLGTIASDIIRVAQHLEAGKLAPGPKTRGQVGQPQEEAPPPPPPPPPAPAPQPPHQQDAPTAYPVDDIDESDVPF